MVGHVAVRPAIYGVLYGLNYNHMLILHGYRDLKSEGFWGYDLDLLGSRDIINHMTISLEICARFYIGGH